MSLFSLKCTDDRLFAVIRIYSLILSFCKSYSTCSLSGLTLCFFHTHSFFTQPSWLVLCGLNRMNSLLLQCVCTWYFQFSVWVLLIIPLQSCVPLPSCIKSVSSISYQVLYVYSHSTESCINYLLLYFLPSLFRSKYIRIGSLRQRIVSGTP